MSKNNGLRDVSIRTQVNFAAVTGNTDFIGVFARSTPERPVPSYWGAINSNGLLAIGKTIRDTPIFLGSVSTLLDPVGQDIHLRFDVVDEQICLFGWQDGTEMPTFPQLITTDTQLTDGAAIGTFLSPNANGGGKTATAVFRYFSVFDPTLLPCDLALNGGCDVADLDAMFAIGDLVTGVPIVADNDRFDVDEDFTIDVDDVAVWLADAASVNGLAAPYLHGDANLDGTVNATDLNALALNWQSPTGKWSDGDFTGNGFVDAADLNELALNWQQSISPAAVTVPEPAAWWPVLACFAFLCLRRKRCPNATLDLKA